MAPWPAPKSAVLPPATPIGGLYCKSGSAAVLGTPKHTATRKARLVDPPCSSPGATKVGRLTPGDSGTDVLGESQPHHGIERIEIRPPAVGHARRSARWPPSRRSSWPSYPRRLPSTTTLGQGDDMSGMPGPWRVQRHARSAFATLWRRASRSVAKRRLSDFVWGFATFGVRRCAPPAPGGPSTKMMVEGI